MHKNGEKIGRFVFCLLDTKFWVTDRQKFGYKESKISTIHVQWQSSIQVQPKIHVQGR